MTTCHLAREQIPLLFMETEETTPSSKGLVSPTNPARTRTRTRTLFLYFYNIHPNIFLLSTPKSP